MNKEELLDLIKFSKDSTKACGIDEVLGLLAEYTEDKRIIKEVDKYIDQYVKACEASHFLYEKCREIQEFLNKDDLE